MMTVVGIVGDANKDDALARVMTEGSGIVARFDLIDSHLWGARFLELDDDGGKSLSFGNEGYVGKAQTSGKLCYGGHRVSAGGKIGHKDGALHAALEVVG